jgi:hypothetical protein
MDEDDRDEIYGLQLNNEHLHAIEKIWDSTALPQSLPSRYFDYDPLADYYNNCPSVEHPDQSKTEELLLDLCIKLLTQHFDDGDPEQNPIIHFSNVCGLQKGNRCFRTPKNYTTYLASFIYMGRLLLLEYALPAQRYSILGLPARDEYKSAVNRMHEVRDPYLIRGQFYPIGELIERMKLGRVIAHNACSKPLMQWLQDKQVLRCLSDEVSMSDFKTWVQQAIVEAETQLKDLMFGFTPTVDLSKVADTISMDKRGYYFALHPDNAKQGMAVDYKELIHRCRMAGPNQMYRNGQWITGSIDNYFNKRNSFLQQLLLCMHLNGGLPARGTEINTIKYRNSDTLRNVIIYCGRLAYINEYHKAKASNNYEIYAARFLPDSVGRLLFLYLVYVRPFCSSLIWQTTGSSTNHTSEHLLFCHLTSPHVPWKSSILSNILKSSSKRHLPSAQFRIANYRQVAVAIADAFLKDEVEKFNFRDVFQDPVGTVIAWQTGHSLSIRQGNYAGLKEYPLNLQPRLLDQYLKVSEAWHRWLEVDKLQPDSTSTRLSLPPVLQTPPIVLMPSPPLSSPTGKLDTRDQILRPNPNCCKRRATEENSSDGETIRVGQSYRKKRRRVE